jgi:hypothetical protein
VLIDLKSQYPGTLRPAKACSGIALHFIQDVSQIFGELSRFGSANQKKEKFI